MGFLEHFSIFHLHYGCLIYKLAPHGFRNLLDETYFIFPYGGERRYEFGFKNRRNFLFGCEGWRLTYNLTMNS